jgi:hypothetical protein
MHARNPEIECGPFTVIVPAAAGFTVSFALLGYITPHGCTWSTDNTRKRLGCYAVSRTSCEYELSVGV